MGIGVHCIVASPYIGLMWVPHVGAQIEVPSLGLILVPSGGYLHYLWTAVVGSESLPERFHCIAYKRSPQFTNNVPHGSNHLLFVLRCWNQSHKYISTMVNCDEWLPWV